MSQNYAEQCQLRKDVQDSRQVFSTFQASARCSLFLVFALVHSTNLSNANTGRQHSLSSISSQTCLMASKSTSTWQFSYQQNLLSLWISLTLFYLFYVLGGVAFITILLLMGTFYNYFFCLCQREAGFQQKYEMWNSDCATGFSYIQSISLESSNVGFSFNYSFYGCVLSYLSMSYAQASRLFLRMGWWYSSSNSLGANRKGAVVLSLSQFRISSFIVGRGGEDGQSFPTSQNSHSSSKVSTSKTSVSSIILQSDWRSK